jgi:predicted nucleic acid-binding protein
LGLLKGIKSSLERKQVKETLLSTQYLDITPDDWEGAAALAAGLRKGGTTLPMTDILIAHLARKNDLEAISCDVHFDRVPGLIHHPLAT